METEQGGYDFRGEGGRAWLHFFGRRRATWAVGGRVLQGMVKSLQNPSLLVIFLVILIKALKILRGLSRHLITLALNHICILVLRNFVSMVMAGSD